MCSAAVPLLHAGGGFHAPSPVVGEALSRPRGVLTDAQDAGAADDLGNAHGFHSMPLARIAARAASRNAVAARASAEENP